MDGVKEFGGLERGAFRRAMGIPDQTVFIKEIGPVFPERQVFVCSGKRWGKGHYWL